jgi:DNA-binding response OmpR family regulator
MPNILIIDDDLEICAGLQKFLRRHGHEVTTATDGQRGLELALKKPDLIICDLHMPQLNGHEVLTALRQEPRLEGIPFIFLSGAASREQIRQGMNLGGDDFITKPAEVAEILAAVNARLLRHQRQLQQRAEEVKKAVQIFAGIVDDLGDSAAAIHWLAEAASKELAGESPSALTAEAAEATAAKATPTNPPSPATFLATKDNRRFFVKLSEVKALLADGEYSRAFWGRDQNMMFRKPLKQWQKELPAQQFVRIHRNAIINLGFLDHVARNPGGKPEIHLKEFKQVLEVSQRKIPTLNRTLRLLAQAN